jgi:hypothetical protein
MGPKPSVIVYFYALRADVREPERDMAQAGLQGSGENGLPDAM